MNPLDFLTRYEVRSGRIVDALPGPQPSPWTGLRMFDRFHNAFFDISDTAKTDLATGQPTKTATIKLPPLYIAQVIVASQQGRLPIQGMGPFPGKLAARGYVDPWQVLRRTTGPNGKLLTNRVELIP